MTSDGIWRGGDHPRACGEKPGVHYIVSEQGGSPPRMRGKVENVVAASKTNGITPAHAGKRSWRPSCGGLQKDHPRACGEKVLAVFMRRASEGSPPRMRGKGKMATQQNLQQGITPAHAGKSSTLPTLVSNHWDHPRACGEKTKESFVNSQLSSGCSKNIIQF